MTGACRDLEVLLSARAAGALEPGESDRLEAHLAGCQACSAEAGGLAEAVGLARLSPPVEAELRALEGLQARVLASWSRTERRRAVRRRVVVGVAAAAAAVAMILAPGALRRAPQPSERAAVAAWQEPDLDDLWTASSAVDSAAEDDGSLTESVLYAAIEDARGF